MEGLKADQVDHDATDDMASDEEEGLTEMVTLGELLENNNNLSSDEDDDAEGESDADDAEDRDVSKRGLGRGKGRGPGRGRGRGRGCGRGRGRGESTEGGADGSGWVPDGFPTTVPPFGPITPPSNLSIRGRPLIRSRTLVPSPPTSEV